MVRLGSKVRDTLTGFSGVATARTVYLYGCVRITITPTDLRDGKPGEDHWFDEQRVEVLEEREPAVSPASSATSGGPQRDPRHAHRPPAR